MKVPMAASSIAPMTSSLMQLVVSSLINAITAKQLREQEKETKVDFFHY